MTTAEVVTTILSVLALAVSLGTLYLTYFRETIKLVGCLAEYTSPDSDALEGAMFEFALSNTGNKDLLIRKATVDLPQQPNALLPELESKEIPTVIKPDQVSLVRLEVPELFLRNAAKTKSTVTIDFEVFGPRAASYHLKKSLPFSGTELDFAPAIWEPFSLEA